MQLDDIRRGYVKYRMETAKENIESAQILLDANKVKPAANRVYYAVFHAMRAILAIDGVDFKHHSGVISYFRKEYIKTGKFDKRFSDIIGITSMIRSGSDYDDYYMVAPEDVKQLIGQAQEFYDAVQKYIVAVIE